MEKNCPPHAGSPSCGLQDSVRKYKDLLGSEAKSRSCQKQKKDKPKIEARKQSKNKNTADAEAAEPWEGSPGVASMDSAGP